jgi:hypothetical protein
MKSMKAEIAGVGIENNEGRENVEIINIEKSKKAEEKKKKNQ